MKRYAMLAALVWAAPAAAQQAVPMPAWLAGAWCTEGPESDRTCEYWTPNSGGVMIGASITTKGGKAVSFEQTRIVPADGTPVYFATPDGGATIAFRAVASEVRSITFAKPDHDYPQRIRYWIEGDELVAEIALADGSKPMRWRYKRLGGGG